MSADFTNIQPQLQTRKGLAIASLILGIVSIPTLGLLGVGAITAIVLGAIALSRSKKEPAIYGGKGMAMAGIITSVASLLLIPVLGILAAIAVPTFNKEIRHTREAVVLNSMRAIHNSEMVFNSEKSRFATLKELWEAGILDHNYMNGVAVNGYVYSSSDVSEKTYCVQAVRTDPAVASRDFIVCEDGIIRYVESKTPGLVKRGEGAELGSSFYTR